MTQPLLVITTLVLYESVKEDKNSLLGQSGRAIDCGINTYCNFLIFIIKFLFQRSVLYLYLKFNLGA